VNSAANMGATDGDSFIIGMTQSAGTAAPLSVAAGAILAACSHLIFTCLQAIISHPSASAATKTFCYSSVLQARSAKYNYHV